MTSAADIRTLTVDATDRALQTSGVYPAVRVGSVLVSEGAPRIFLDPDPTLAPSPGSTGWPVDTAAALVSVRLRESPTYRTAYLWIGAGPFTGDFVLNLDDGDSPATFTAAASTRAAVLAGLLAEIQSVYGSEGLGLLDETQCVTLAISGSGSADAIRIVAVDPEDGTQGTFDLLDGTQGPTSSDMVVLREAYTAALAAWCRPASNVSAAIDNAATAAMRTGWAPLTGLPSGQLSGFAQTWQTGGVSALWVQIVDPDYGGDTVGGESVGVNLSALVAVDPCESQP